MPNVRRVHAPANSDEPTLEELSAAKVGLARMMKRHETTLKRGDVWTDCVSALRRLQAEIEARRSADDLSNELDDILKGAA